MAPEVVLGQPYNEKVDVFSFGVILFEVLNRKLMLVDEIKNDPRKDAQVCVLGGGLEGGGPPGAIALSSVCVIVPIRAPLTVFCLLSPNSPCHDVLVA